MLIFCVTIVLFCWSCFISKTLFGCYILPRNLSFTKVEPTWLFRWLILLLHCISSIFESFGEREIWPWCHEHMSIRCLSSGEAKRVWNPDKNRCLMFDVGSVVASFPLRFTWRRTPSFLLLQLRILIRPSFLSSSQTEMLARNPKCVL